MPPRRAPARGAAAARGASNNDDSIAVDVNAMNIKIEAGETTPEAPQMKYDQAPIQADPTVPQAPMTAQADGNAPVANMMGPPASTASRPPVQRLASLRGRAATRGARGASTSASASSSPAPEGAAGAPKPAPAKTRFRPKAAVRKTAEEREALAAEEAARVANEERAANRGRGRGRGGRGRGGRGRGDARMGGERIVTGTATGIFSQMSDSPRRGGAAQQMSRPSGSSGGGGFSSMVRSGLGGGSGGGSRRDGDAGSEPVYPEELEDDNVAPRLDIELINISDDEDDVIITGSRKTNKAMRPIRLERQEHVERPTVVNVETKTGVDLKALDKKREVKSEKDTDSMFVEHSIKGENDMDLDSIPHVSRDGSVDLDAPADRRESIDLDATVPEPYTEEQMAERRAGKSKTKTKKKSKPVLQTQEDLAEYEILLNDTAEISQQLATLQASSTALNGDIEMGEDGQPKADNPDHKEGRLYLFQFPPILPRLMTEEELEKERDGVKTDAGGDIEMSDIPAANASDPVDLTAAASTPASPTKFKAEPTEVLPPNPVSTPQPLVNEAGQIGRLVVRKSGKVEVSWGGTSLALSNGAKTDFLTKGVVVHGVDKGGKQNREITKEEEMKMLGTGMGKLWGKFVATPDWEKLL